MTPEAWESDLSLTADTVRRVLAAQFPELADAGVDYFNEGWDTWIFSVGRHLFRFPKREESDKTLRMELRLLSDLEDAVPLPIPSFDFVGKPSALFPYHFAGYEKMSGVTVFDSKTFPPHPEKIALQLGGFLNRLHAFPRDKAEKLGVSMDENLDVLPVILEDARSRLSPVRAVLPPDFFASVEKCLGEDLSSFGRHQGPSRMIHNDFSHEHVLLNGDLTRVTGILDWGDAEFGDPAMDFAGCLQWLGPDHLESVLKAYTLEVDPDLRKRARFLACCEGIQDIHYGIETGKKAFALWGAKAVRNALR